MTTAIIERLDWALTNSELVSHVPMGQYRAVMGLMDKDDQPWVSRLGDYLSVEDAKKAIIYDKATSVDVVYRIYNDRGEQVGHMGVS